MSEDTQFLMNFNSRPSARGDADRCDKQQLWGIFQFTPLREGRHSPCNLYLSICNFNSRPSARGDPAFSFVTYKNFIFQFTPLREGRPLLLRRLKKLARISIHAPPRGATIRIYHDTNTRYYFNSRPSARGDARRRRRRAGRPISIHAPPRGATRAYCLPLPVRMLFQFTPLREGRRRPKCFPSPPPLFQFTPLREGRRRHPTHRWPEYHFNSRPSARGDGLIW